jgi:hypothetical protein
MHQSGAYAWPTAIQQNFRKQVQQMQDAEALVTLGREAANTQMRLGMAEQAPRVQQSGMMGRTAMVLGSFSHQTAAQTHEVYRGGVHPVEQVKFTARLAAITAAAAGTTAVTGWNVWKYHYMLSLAFGGGPPMHAILNAFNVMTGSTAYITGQYVTPEQNLALNQAARAGVGGALTKLSGIGNPYLGTAQLLGKFADALTGTQPVETTARLTALGERPTSSRQKLTQRSISQSGMQEPMSTEELRAFFERGVEPLDEVFPVGGGATQ